MPLPSCPALVLPNAGARGYFRTALDPAALKLVEANIPKLSGPERLTVLADEWALVRASLHDVGSYLDLASAFKSERNEQVLSSLFGSLRTIDAYIASPGTRPRFRTWVSDLLGPAAQQIGWDSARAADDDNTRALRASLLRQLGDAGDTAATTQARRLVDQELASPKSVEPTLLNVAVSIAPMSGDQALYDKYVARFKAAVDPEDRYRFLYGLASFSDPALVRRTMDYALGPEVRSQDTKLLIANMLGNPAARDQV